MRSLRIVVRRSDMSHHRCPGCGSWDVARSSLGVVDRLVKLFGHRPYRCLTCHKRFYDRSLAPAS